MPSLKKPLLVTRRTFAIIMVPISTYKLHCCPDEETAPVMHTLPKLNARYWLTLVPASTFGTNTGDVMSDGFGLGHVTGLPWIIGALLLVFMAEHASPRKTALFFWAAIIIIRTGAPRHRRRIPRPQDRFLYIRWRCPRFLCCERASLSSLLAAFGSYVGRRQPDVLDYNGWRVYWARSAETQYHSDLVSRRSVPPSCSLPWSRLQRPFGGKTAN